MSPEAWIALGGGVLTILTIVYQAGQLGSKIDNLSKNFAEHSVEDRENFNTVFNRVNQHSEDIAGLKVGSGMHMERRPQTGGHRQVGAGE